MVVLENPTQFRFIRFEKSRNKDKKYDAILQNKRTKKERRVAFGDSNYEQYKDSTGLGLYSHLDHLDPKRRELYRARHRWEDNALYSSGYFAYKYLW